MATRKAPAGGRKKWFLERPRGAPWRWRSREDPRVTVGYTSGRARVSGRWASIADVGRTLTDRRSDDGVQKRLLKLLETAEGGFRRGARDAWAEGASYEARATDLRELGDDYAERWRRILEDEEGSTLAEVRERHPGMPAARDPEGDLMLARRWEISLPGRRAYRSLLKDGWRIALSVEVFTFNAVHNPIPEQSTRGKTRRPRTPVGAVERPGSPYWIPSAKQARATGTAAKILRRMQDMYEGELLGVGLRLRAERA